MIRLIRAICKAAGWSLILLVAAPAWGQTAGPLLRGNITDPSGAAIANATVHLVNPADNSDHTAVSDQAGRYVFSDIAPGYYRLRIDVQGFDPYEQDDVHLLANVAATVDVVLKLKKVQESVTVRAQDTMNQCLIPQTRILPDVGPGLRALRRGPSGNYYVLTVPGADVAIYSPDGKRVGQVPTASSIGSQTGASILNGVDLQVDPTGRVYVADLSASAVKIYSPDGMLASRIAVPAPMSVQPLFEGEVGVSSMSSTHLVDVYDEARGQLSHSFGEIEPPAPVRCDAVTLQCTMPKKDLEPAVNRSWFYGDSSGSVYVNVADAGVPTIRKYDSAGYMAYESKVPLDHAITAADNSGWKANPEIRLTGVPTAISLTDSGNTTSTSCQGNSNPPGTTTLCNNQQVPGGTPGGAGPGGGLGGGMPGGMAGGPGGGMGGGMRGMGMDGGGGGGMRGGGEMGGMGGGRGMEGGVQFGLRITQGAGGPSGSNPVITAIGVDPQTSEVWAAVGDNLAHFGPDGTLEGYYCLSITNPTPIKINAILVEPNRLLLGTDPFGVFQYSRPDKPLPGPALPQ